MGHSRDSLKFNGWGLEGRSFELGSHSAAFWSFLGDALGTDTSVVTPPLGLADIALGDSRLVGVALESLESILSTDRIETSRRERVFHALGRSYRDVLRLRSGDLPEVPDAVVYPETADEVQALLEWATTHRVAVVPFGGGSSVVGGVEAHGGAEHRALVTLDTTRLDALLSVDEASRTATLQAGMYGPDVETALSERGYTLGHYPQSFEFSTLGGWIAAAGSGQFSSRYGAASSFLVSAQLVTPTGVLSTLKTPHASTGPDLTQSILGSEGTLGVITEATVRVHLAPEKREIRGYLFPDFERGSEAVRALSQEGAGVCMMRLSDAEETDYYLHFKSLRKHGGERWIDRQIHRVMDAWAGAGEGVCVLLVGAEGTRAQVREVFPQVSRRCMAHRGIPLGKGVGDAWYRTRFETPYLRASMMDRGVAVDTLETSATWADLHRLHKAVRKAISEAIASTAPDPAHRAVVMSHVSHTYPEGASLYFTFIFPMAEGREMAQWKQIKSAASQTISDLGATISHHHGVGLDHRDWMEDEKSTAGITVLHAMKRALDPEGVLNPGKLIGHRGTR